jgi:hypothetical protein
MLKTLLLVLAGLVAGLAIASWLPPASPPTLAEAAPAGASAPVEPVRVDTSAAARLAALETALDAEILQRAALEERVGELAEQLQARGEPVRMPRAAEAASADAPNPAVAERMRVRREAGLSPEERQRRNVEQLIAAGFAPDRAEWILRRTEELRMQAMQAQYEARRDGRPQPVESGEANALRTELGDADYERFLTAMGRSTTVTVFDVLASSPAERSGVQPGDEIVAYNGRRVFDAAELNELTVRGTTGESVVVDVRRNGQTLQLVLPRGPLGIMGGFRGPPSFLER